MSEDIDDLFDKIKEYFKLNSNLFDMDFFIFPESDSNVENVDKKGFKISYHYDSKLDKPEISIEGDFDEKKLREYFKDHKIKPDKKFDKIFNSQQNSEIDAIELSLEPCEGEKKTCIIEPSTEVNDSEKFHEIILEAPGIEERDILLSFDDKKKNILLSTKNKIRNYQKYITVPFKPSLKEYSLEVNNGIVILRFKK